MSTVNPRLGTSLLICALATSTLAQQPPVVDATPADRVAADNYTTAESLRLFAACDRDADDRLDLFEAAAAFDAIGDPPDLERFRRLDLDRDGFISWIEFDQWFRDTVRHGQPLRVHPARPLANDRTGTAPMSTEQQLLQLFDTDGSGDLSMTEMGALLKAANLPPSLLSRVKALDRDGSGSFSMAELLPVLAGVPIPGLTTKVAPADATLLPAPFGSWDKNRDGAIDEAELAAALRSIDPQLARWAPAILRQADRNHDGRLVTEELNVPTSAPQAVVEKGVHR